MGGKPSAVYRNRMERYDDEVWLIWSNKWNCWYRSECAGYTSDIAQAGLYGRETAALHYCGNVPRRHRATEPFPLSSVKALILRRLRALHDQITEHREMVEHLHAMRTDSPKFRP